MLKKIILGIVITVVLSVTAFGAVYAYQKEKVRTVEPVNEQNLQLQYGAGPGADCDEYAAGEHADCLKEEERARNNLRQRENEDQECIGQDGKEHMWQHRYEYENQCLETGQENCDEGGQSKNQNGNNSNGKGGK